MIRFAARLAAVVAWPAVAGAQVLGVPVVNSGHTGGSTIAVDYAMPGDAAGGGSAIGAALSYGSGALALTASGSRYAPDDGEAIWSSGGALGYRLFGGPLVPFRVTALAGAAFWAPGPRITAVHVPLSLGLSATLPNPAFAIRPWLAPRLDYLHTSFDGVGVSSSAFALSGGIELAFINGLRLRAAYDRRFDDGDPSILAFGVGYALGR
jgi:hypothetical protein